MRSQMALKAGGKLFVLFVAGLLGSSMGWAEEDSLPKDPAVKADADATPQDPPRRRGRWGRNRPIFKEIDKDKDGFISKQELETFREAKRAERAKRRAQRRPDPMNFSEIDKDKDGKISPEEFQGHRKQRPRRAR